MNITLIFFPNSSRTPSVNPLLAKSARRLAVYFHACPEESSYRKKNSKVRY